MYRRFLHSIVLIFTFGLGLSAFFSEPIFAQSNPVPVVVTSPIKSVPMNQLKLTGTLVSKQRSSVSSRVSGQVNKMYVEAGDEVKAGDILLELDDAYAQIELRRLQATVAVANAEVKEDRHLVDEGKRLAANNNLPQSELVLRSTALEAALARLAAAKAELAAQAERLKWHKVIAPFNGVIYDKLTEQGEWVVPGDALLELVSREQLYLDLQVPQEKFLDIASVSEVEVLPDSIERKTIKARVATVVPVAVDGSRTFRVRLSMLDSHEALVPGFSATALFNLAKGDQEVLIVPRDALIRNPDGGFSLFTAENVDGVYVARRQMVKIGERSHTGIEIKEGLTANAKVVIRGNEVLRNDQPIKVQLQD